MTSGRFTIQYSEEQLLETLRKANESVSGSLSIQKYRNLGWTPSDKTYTNRFGSWSNALELAGIKYNNDKFSMSFTKEEAIEQLQHYYKKHNKHLTYDIYKSNNYSPTVTALSKKFGSWNSALIAANIPLNKLNKQKYTKSEIISHLREVSNSKYITVREYKSKSTSPSVEVIIGTFGSWSKATQVAGLTK